MGDATGKVTGPGSRAIVSGETSASRLALQMGGVDETTETA